MNKDEVWAETLDFAKVEAGKPQPVYLGEKGPGDSHRRLVVESAGGESGKAESPRGYVVRLEELQGGDYRELASWARPTREGVLEIVQRHDWLLF